MKVTYLEIQFVRYLPYPGIRTTQEVAASGHCAIPGVGSISPVGSGGGRKRPPSTAPRADPSSLKAIRMMVHVRLSMGEPPGHHRRRGWPKAAGFGHPQVDSISKNNHPRRLYRNRQMPSTLINDTHTHTTPIPTVCLLIACPSVRPSIHAFLIILEFYHESRCKDRNIYVNGR